MNSKKSISPIIAVTLLIVVSVFSIIAFQAWFGFYSTNIYSDVEIQSKTNSKIEIVDIVYDKLFIKNTILDNYSNFVLKIGDKECIIGNLSLGLKEYNISSCLSELNNSFDITIISENNIDSKKKYLKNTPKNLIVSGSSCDLGSGVIMSHLESRTFYNKSYGAPCNFQIRTCENGILNGSDSYNLSSCLEKTIFSNLRYVNIIYNVVSVNCAAGSTYTNMNLGRTLKADQIYYSTDNGNTIHYLQEVVSARTVDYIYYVTKVGNTIYMQRPQNWKLACTDDSSNRYAVNVPGNATHIIFAQS